MMVLESVGWRGDRAEPGTVCVSWVLWVLMLCSGKLLSSAAVVSGYSAAD